MGGEETSGDEGGSPAPEVDHRLQTPERQMGGDSMWSSGWGLALSRCFFPREAQVGETVPTPSLVVSKVPPPRGEGPSKAGSIHCKADSSAVQTPMLPRHVAKIGSLGWTWERMPFPGVPSPAPRTFWQRWPVGAGEHPSSAARG